MEDEINEFQVSENEATYKLTARGVMMYWIMKIMDGLGQSYDHEALLEEVQDLEILLFERGYWIKEISNEV